MHLTEATLEKIVKRVPAVKIDGEMYVPYDTITLEKHNGKLLMSFCKDSDRKMEQEFAVIPDLRKGEMVTIQGLIGVCKTNIQMYGR